LEGGAACRRAKLQKIARRDQSIFDPAFEKGKGSIPSQQKKGEKKSLKLGKVA